MTVEELLKCYESGQRNFTRLRLNRATLSKAELPLIVLTEAALRGADLSEALLAGAELIKTDLCKATLIQANLIGANLAWANLRRADLHRTMLSGAVLTGANLSQAMLNHASLSGANLVGANLKGANLQNANLKGADLKTANLLDANLKGADLEGADLMGATLPNGDRAIVLDEEPANWASIIQTQQMDPVSDCLLSEDRCFTAVRSTVSDETLAAQLPERASESLAAEADWLAELSQKTTNIQHIPSEPVETLKSVVKSGRYQQGNYQFRQKLLRLYNRRCAITGCTAEPVLEVAYIIPQTHLAMGDPSNGLLLRADLHILFERHLLTIEPDSMTILLAPELQETDYGMLKGKSIFLPDKEAERPSQQALTEHFQQCGWREDRAAWPEGYVV